MPTWERKLLDSLRTEPGYAPNLAAANDAVAYVRQAMTKGADNKFKDKAPTFFSTSAAIELDECVANVKSDVLDISIANDPVLPSWIIKAAAKAEQAGCGNCREQACIALVYLFNKKHVRVVDYMKRTNIDHAFVVIGRKAGSDESDYKTWGESCIVCDPWDEKAFPASDIPKSAYKGATFAVKSFFRYPL